MSGQITPVKVQVGVEQAKNSHEIPLRIADQNLGLPSTNDELVSVQEAAIIIIQTKPVTRRQRHVPVAFAQEKQVPVLDDKRFGDTPYSARPRNQLLRGRKTL